MVHLFTASVQGIEGYLRPKPKRIYEYCFFRKTGILTPTVLHRRIVVARCSIHSHLQLLALGGFAAQKKQHSVVFNLLHLTAQKYHVARPRAFLIGHRDAAPYSPSTVSFRGYCYSSSLGSLYCRAIIHRVYFSYAHLLVA